MKLASISQLLKPDIQRLYQYCGGRDSAFPAHIVDCIACVQDIVASQTLVRYLEILKDACD